LAIIKLCINLNSKVNDIVIDCFGGSGSTLIASELLKRKCYMMELDPAYCDVIIERWENLTGQKAELIEKG
jgi:DNA modification methylase